MDRAKIAMSTAKSERERDRYCLLTLLQCRTLMSSRMIMIK